jgi:serine/threonine protein kinase
MAKYKFGTEIGSGGFGVVRNATRDEDGLRCVVKILKDGCSDLDISRFLREVRIQSQLRHKNIVPILGTHLKQPPYWFAMPKAVGNLRERASDVSDDWEEIFLDILRGVSYAHESGIIHRDLKPENILIFESNDGKKYAAVSDFGLGRAMERDTTTLTAKDSFLGTYFYCPPEQMTNAKDVDESADVYALGKILYELSTGDLPFPRMDLRKVPPEYAHLVRKSTRDEADRRYSSAKELLNSFEIASMDIPDEETLEEEIGSAIEALSENPNDNSKLEGLIDTILRNADDEAVLLRHFPRLTTPVLVEFIRKHPEEFVDVLEKYDEAISGSLPFAYCDVVANFYRRVFNANPRDRVDIFQILLCRLPRLGYNHNRWHVGEVFGSLVARVRDRRLVAVLVDCFGQKEAALDWCSPYVDASKIARALRGYFLSE